MAGGLAKSQLGSVTSGNPAAGQAAGALGGLFGKKKNP
jgi:hypothetical protein